MAPEAPGQSESGNTRLFWVQHADAVWIPCQLHSVNGSTASLVAEDGEIFACSAKAAQGLEQVQDRQLDGVEDICSLSVVSEAALLHTIRERYARQFIYTRVSRILVSVNPFCALPIYSVQHLRQYQQVDDSSKLPPHIFGTGLDAIQGLSKGCRDQAIVISGESGAGKTESAKFLLSFVADYVRSAETGLEAKVVETNPVLEAFGNAMTTRNANSSRFGKWLDLRFSSTLGLLGCRITSYLLEVTRVSGQTEGERSFHIFFQLLSARHSPQLSSLRLKEPGHYRYLKSSVLVAPGIDDSQGFMELCRAAEALNFGTEELLEVFRVAAAVLSLGNCDFCNEAAQSEELVLDGSSAAEAAEVARLLAVDARKLTECMLRRRVVTGRDVIETPLRLDQARAARDGIARMLYGRLFEWLMQRMNERLQLGEDLPSSGEARDRLLGVLDISGFESFDLNSLEQLLINLSNEQLQNQFNEAVFKSEMEDCVKEGVDLGAAITYVDNSDCVALLDGRGGILDMMDEEIAYPKATDLTFANKVVRGHGKHARLVIPKFNGAAVFGIQHYAATVNYTCDGFLEKNADRLPSTEVSELLAASELALLRELGRGLQEMQAAQGTAGATSKAKSATFKFRTSLRALMSKIGAADTHYVRCIKPNLDNVAKDFSSRYVHEQLRYSGVLEAVRIRQKGFGSRLTFEEFLHRYHCIASVRHPSSSSTPPRRVEPNVLDLLSSLRRILVIPDGGEIVIGKTKVFAKAKAATVLEEARAHAFDAAVLHAQRLLRGARIRRCLRPLRPWLLDLLRWLDRCSPHQDGQTFLHRLQSLSHEEEELSKLTSCLQGVASLGSSLGIPIPMLPRVASVHQRLMAEVLALRRMADLLSSMQPEAIAEALAVAAELNLPATSDGLQSRLQERLAHLQLQLPLLAALQMVLESQDVVEAEQLLLRLEGAGLGCASPAWIIEDAKTLCKEVVVMVDAEKERLQRIEAERLAALQRRKALTSKCSELAAEAALRSEEAKRARTQAEEAERLATAAAADAMAAQEALLAAGGPVDDDGEAGCSHIANGQARLNFAMLKPQVSTTAAATADADELRQLILRLSEERDEFHRALQAAHLNSVRREEAMQAVTDGGMTFGHLTRQQLEEQLAAERLSSQSLRAELKEVQTLSQSGLLLS